jgi:hypothetical protein
MRRFNLLHFFSFLIQERVTKERIAETEEQIAAAQAKFKVNSVEPSAESESALVENGTDSPTPALP